MGPAQREREAARAAAELKQKQEREVKVMTASIMLIPFCLHRPGLIEPS